MGRLLRVFEEAEGMPEGMKTRLCELDEQRAGLLLEIARVQQELEEVGGEEATSEEIADFLRAFTEEIRGLPMAEKKAQIRSVIARLTHNHFPASEGTESARASCTKGHFPNFGPVGNNPDTSESPGIGRFRGFQSDSP
jgi:hypothetical protein